MRHLRVAIPLLCALLASSLCGAQEIVIVTVRSFGQGLTEAAAVKDAVVEAVGRVSGERIASQSVAQTKSAESTSGTSEHSARFEQRIDSLIRGVVKSSRTLSVGRDATSGTYKAEVEVSVAPFRQSEQLKRVKLAVVMGAQGLPRAFAGDSGSFTQALLNGVSDKLVNSRKFAVLDRQQRDAAQREFSRITSGGSAVENYVRLQSGAIADFLVVVDVTEYTTGRSALGSERARSSARAIVYDYTSGQIRQAVTAVSQRPLRDDSGLGLATQLGADLGDQIIDNTFPARVIAFEGGDPVINAGFGQFDVGESVDVFREGQALRDPYTKEILGNTETRVAQGTIDLIMPRTAVVRLRDAGRLPDGRGISYVVRRSSVEPSTDKAAGADHSLQVKKGRTNDDW